MSRLSRYAWAVLGFNVAVILWGAYVRATGSGAGCGAHWPLCNGEVVPRAPTPEMLVEFSHRVTSGLALLSVVVLLFWTWRVARPGQAARRGAAWAMFFMLTEAAVGAALVLFRLVADNPSMARALFMSVHLINTFLLLACLTLTAYWLSGGAALRPSARRLTASWITAGAVALGVAAVSGAVTALGDTLYPSGSIAEGLAADLSATSHLLIRLRILHPTIAIAVGVALIVAILESRHDRSRAVRRAAMIVALLVTVQIAAGFLNVFLLAPVAMQIVHLLLADALWIAYVLFAALALALPDPAPRPARA